MEPLRRAGVRGALAATFDDPSAWNVCTIGTRLRRGLGRGQAAHPEVGVHHVGRVGSQCAVQLVGERGHVWQQLVLGHGGGRPAASAPPARRPHAHAAAAAGRRAWCRPRPGARAGQRAASAATCTFCPPASTPPSAASGLACSETIAIFIATPPRAWASVSGCPARRCTAATTVVPTSIVVQARVTGLPGRSWARVEPARGVLVAEDQ